MIIKYFMNYILVPLACPSVWCTLISGTCFSHVLLQDSGMVQLRMYRDDSSTLLTMIMGGLAIIVERL